MKHLLFSLLVFSTTLLVTPCLMAQDPFGVEEPAAVPAAPADEAPAATGPAETDPLVISIQASQPKTPRALVRAIINLLRIQRPDAARPYVEQLLAARPADATLVEVHREFGSAPFIRIAMEEQLQPQGEQLARAVLAAVDRQRKNRALLQAAVGRLGDSAAETRAAALADLQEAGQAAAVPLLKALAGASARQRDVIQQALVYLGKPMVDPLLAALQAKDENLASAAAGVLGRLRAQQAMLFLLRPSLAEDSSKALRAASRDALIDIRGAAVSRGDAAALLKNAANDYLRNRPPRRPDEDNRVQWWIWDAGRGEPVSVSWDAADASLYLAGRLAQDLYRLTPENRENRRLYLVTYLGLAKLQSGWDRPLRGGNGTPRAAAAAYGAAAIEEALTESMQRGRIGAAIAAIEILSDLGDRRLLDSWCGATGPLTAALKHSDRRLKFAAAQAIMKIDPHSDYLLSSVLMRTIGKLIRSTGSPRVLIGAPHLGEAQTLAAMLGGLGYEADTALTGRQTFQAAVRHPDYEFILIHDAIDHRNARELTQMLRRDYRTASIPIGLMARIPYYVTEDDRADAWDWILSPNAAAALSVDFAPHETRLRKMRQIARLDDRTQAMYRIHTPHIAALALHRLRATLGRRFVSADERLHHAQAALGWLLQIAKTPKRYPFYDVMQHQPSLIEAIDVPELSQAAAEALGYLGGAPAQQALVNAASDDSLPIAEREAAQRGFAEAVRRRGIMLTLAEIKQQYRRYNRSRDKDALTQRVLGLILDTIEAPTALSRAP